MWFCTLMHMVDFWKWPVKITLTRSFGIMNSRAHGWLLKMTCKNNTNTVIWDSEPSCTWNCMLSVWSHVCEQGVKWAACCCCSFPSIILWCLTLRCVQRSVPALERVPVPCRQHPQVPCHQHRRQHKAGSQVLTAEERGAWPSAMTSHITALVPMVNCR